MFDAKTLSRAAGLIGAAACLLALPPGLQASGRGVIGLMPVPAEVTIQPGRFRIGEDLTIAGQGPASPRAFRAAARFMARLSGRTGLFLKQDYLAGQSPAGKANVVYRYQAVGRLLPGEDESYTLSVAADGAVIAAPNDLGVLHGLETLLQLLDADETGYYFPCVEIRDRPRFTWRGLLIDVSRHFEPVDVILRNLDGMAALKMNVLHWHLTDDQGFRVESKVFPKLQELGSDGLYYTQDEVREVVAYAADRGIRVMPEFDIPGHSTSWLVAYPEYASSPGPYVIERHFGVFGPAFDPTNDRVYSFFDKFFKEMAGLFPDPYIHIGGDEVNPDQWNTSRRIRAFMKKKGLADNPALQAYFNERILKILKKCGKKMVGWDEIYRPGVPKDIVIQSWRGPDALVDAARNGYQGILSNGYYVDLCEPAASHYLNDPIPTGSPLTDAQRALIFGGEASMWGELITPETIDSRIWPRTAAIAERLWSPQSVANVEDMYRRLGLVSVDLEELGLTHLKNRDMMLRRLARTENIEPLRVLSDAVEPLKGYKRHDQGITYTSLSPLTRFVDACLPESLPVRAFRVRVDEYLKERDQAVAEELRATLRQWENNHPLVLPLVAASPALREIEALSQALADVSAAGLEALDILTSGRPPEAGWLSAKGRILAEAEKPKAHAELAVTSAVEELVNACAGAEK
jgi:hexosaminidase